MAGKVVRSRGPDRAWEDIFTCTGLFIVYCARRDPAESGGVG